MNKIYISISLVASMLLANKSMAQITLSSTYLPQVGYTYNMVADTTPADLPTFTVSAGSASAQTWDYSAGFNIAYSAATSFVAPGSNPGASSFPNSNLASDQGGGNWGYLISGSTGLFVDGAYVSAQGVTAALDFMPNAPQLPTPFTYGNTTTVTYTATGNTTYNGIFPVVINHHAVRTVTADAFGSITTPTGTYSNTLRVVTHEIRYDSISVSGTNQFNQYDTTTNYSWYQNSQDALIMSIDQNTAGATTKAEYLQTFSNAVNAIKNNELATNLYPNPTSTLTYLSYENATSSKVSANIFDVTGKHVATILSNQQQAAGKQTLAIDINNLQLAQGLYMVQLTVNGATKTIKLNVQ
jgi:hypothetical protein